MSSDNLSFLLTVLPDQFTADEDVDEISGLIGQPLVITCTVTRSLGLVNEPVITLLDSQNNVVMTIEGSITVGEPVSVEASDDRCDDTIITTSTLEFMPLLDSHTDTYTCRAELESSIPLIPRIATWEITVAGEQTVNCLTN